MTGNNKINFLKVLNNKFESFFGGQKHIFYLRKRQRIFILILSIKPNGDQMNALLLILHLIPISTPPSIDRNSALTELFWKRITLCVSLSAIYAITLLHFKHLVNF